MAYSTAAGAPSVSRGEGIPTLAGGHQSFIAKYEGGERRLDVVEFLAITRAIGADPIKLMKSLIKQF